MMYDLKFYHNVYNLLQAKLITPFLDRKAQLSLEKGNETRKIPAFRVQGEQKTFFNNI